MNFANIIITQLLSGQIIYVFCITYDQKIHLWHGIFPRLLIMKSVHIIDKNMRKVLSTLTVDNLLASQPKGTEKPRKYWIFNILMKDSSP